MGKDQAIVTHGAASGVDAGQETTTQRASGALEPRNPRRGEHATVPVHAFEAQRQLLYRFTRHVGELDDDGRSAAVDFDMLRLPNRVLVPTAILTLLALAGLAAATQDWSTVVLPAVAACLTGTVLAGVHVASKGGIGFGDVKLATAMSLAVGPLGVGAVWLALLAGSAAALIWVKATRRDGPIPYGPWLLCGCWIAALASAVPVRE